MRYKGNDLFFYLNNHTTSKSKREDGQISLLLTSEEAVESRKRLTFKKSLFR